MAHYCSAEELIRICEYAFINKHWISQGCGGGYSDIIPTWWAYQALFAKYSNLYETHKLCPSFIEVMHFHATKRAEYIAFKSENKNYLTAYFLANNYDEDSDEENRRG